MNFPSESALISQKAKNTAAAQTADRLGLPLSQNTGAPELRSSSSLQPLLFLFLTLGTKLLMQIQNNPVKQKMLNLEMKCLGKFSKVELRARKKKLLKPYFGQQAFCRRTALEHEQLKESSITDQPTNTY